MAAAVSASSSSEFASAFLALCSEVKVSALARKGHKVLTVNSTDTPTEAFTKVLNAGYLSAPVKGKDGNYIGFVDVRDLVKYVVFLADEHKKEASEGKKKESRLGVPRLSFQRLFDESARMYDKAESGITVVYLARKQRFVRVSLSEPLLRAVELLSDGGVHRVAVVDDDGNVVDILSQSTVIAWIHKSREKLADVLKEVVGDKIGSRPVIPTKSNENMLACLRTMSKHNRSGIAVVDSDSGRLLGNTSASDLKLFLKDGNLDALHSLSVLDFLAKIRQAEVGDDRSPTMTVASTATLDKVIARLHATRVHRLFVAEDKSGFKPLAVISLTDVLRHLLRAGSKAKIVVESA